MLALGPYPLVLLSATAGFGKTTLLASWARLQQSPVAWLQLDALDNDPARFWLSLLTAMRVCWPYLGESLLAQLNALQPPLLLSLATTLINEIAQEKQNIMLVLDDYHIVENPLIQQVITFLVEHAPSHFHLLLASRVDPDLPLARWRFRGLLGELRTSELRLNAVEAAHYVQRVAGQVLSEETLNRLLERTEGWIAGMQLAALSLRGQADPTSVLPSLSGKQRFLLDYVQDEILAQQAPEVRHFLLRASILERLQADLCQAVLSEPNSQMLLEQAERSNLFLVALDEDRQWFRFHTLFREALLALLCEQEPETLPGLHQRAGIWLAEHEQLHEAINHLLTAQDYPTAAQLIRRFISPQHWRNEYRTLLTWLEWLPREEVLAHPDLSFWWAFSLILTSLHRLSDPGLSVTILAALQQAEEGFRAAGNVYGVGQVHTMRMIVSANQGDFSTSIEEARLALDVLPAHDRQWRYRALAGAALGSVFHGDLRAAYEQAQEALTLSTAARWLPSMQDAAVYLGEVYLRRGELGQAASYFRQSQAFAEEYLHLSQLQLVQASGLRLNHYDRMALYCLAAIAYARNEIDEARSTMQNALKQGPMVFFPTLTPGFLLQLRLALTPGSPVSARTLLQQHVTDAKLPLERREANLAEAWLALKQGNLAHTQRWAAQLLAGSDGDYPYIRRCEEQLLLARLCLAEGRADEALAQLSILQADGEAHEHVTVLLETLVLTTLAHQALGASNLAQGSLREALTRAQPEENLRLFLDEGDALVPLLAALLPDLQDQPLHDFVARLLSAAMPAQTSSDLLETLTPQETRVLHLLAAGFSNQQIAEELVITLVTAKKHVSNILGKLNVSSRTQALAQARKRGLL
ncbi:LuxR family transcriptional regulator [Dictyobacter aurantiacus]|uniref:LuxR family transcriptional regulator n=2 Tax=Dictyobacter aurantiacus TaxID=1936993 RepID=A0A401ZTI0_9CHLR|nr:LuxR family transcriptional regulator [Dictyobacter aurantiacus]GCE10112.1 LuxR family transcriptional regulator [Dictyobacter aurantiacus]